RIEPLAEEIGGTAVAGDASDIVAAARDALGGTVDVYCANAGLASPGDAFADEEVWAAAWDVNVMAHVRAARALLPQWLERGSGRFVTTASAAGLLTMIGAAPYSVTKHGAVAFAEWLSLTYRHRGVKVHAICPQGVRTDMLTAAGSAGELVLAPGAIEPDA
ncbi:SDR family oxidoreductase, partial [Streptomyces sp. SID8455]|nr:SDR family oxidoreductase [Streptomyces sp. SID8455]